MPQAYESETDAPQAYVSGNAVIILKGPQEILQTIHVDEVDELEAVTIEESSGRVAICSKEQVFIYGPIGRDEGLLKVEIQTNSITITDTATVVAHPQLGHGRDTASLHIIMGLTRRAPCRWRKPHIMECEGFR